MAFLLIDDKIPATRFAVTDATTGPFVVEWPFFAESDLKLYVGDSTTPLALGTDYTVAGTPAEDGGGYTGGTVTLVSPISNTTLTIRSDIPYDRTASFPRAGAFNIDALNTALNRIARQMQQLRSVTLRSVRMPEAEVEMGPMPPAAQRANRLMGFDAAGNPIPIMAGQGGAAEIIEIATAAQAIAQAAQATANTAKALAEAAQADIAGYHTTARTWTQRQTFTGGVTLQGAQLREARVTVTTAGTLDIGTLAGNYMVAAGDGEIVSFGSVPAGVHADLRLDGAITLKHSASLICPDAADFVGVAGDVLRLRSEGGGAWRVVGYMLSTARPRAGFSRYFESAELGIVLGAGQRIAHTLGGTPRLMMATARCKIATGGYLVGDEVQFSTGYRDSGGSEYDRNTTWGFDASGNLFLTHGRHGTSVMNIANGVAMGVGAPHWVAVLRAWR